jgi:hypothetical protein
MANTHHTGRAVSLATLQRRLALCPVLQPLPTGDSVELLDASALRELAAGHAPP